MKREPGFYWIIDPIETKNIKSHMRKGAEFSEDRKYRYVLWRIWDEDKHRLMVIGLNPSTANEAVNDATIKRVMAIAFNLGYGGVYMLNCFAYISTDPDHLITLDSDPINDAFIKQVASVCKDTIFAWGNFKVVRDKERDKELTELFPNALALFINKNGSPKHPLFCKKTIKPVKWKSNL